MEVLKKKVKSWVPLVYTLGTAILKSLFLVVEYDVEEEIFTEDEVDLEASKREELTLMVTEMTLDQCILERILCEKFFFEE